MDTHVKTLIITLGVCVGIFVGGISSHASEIALFMVALIVIQGCIFFWERSLPLQYSLALVTLLLSIGTVVGIVRMQLVEERVSYVCEKSCTFEGEIISSPETKNDYQVIVVTPTTKEKNILNIQVRAPLYPRYHSGEVLTISGKVTIPKPVPSHVNTTKPFDYRAYLASKNIGSETMYPRIEIKDEGKASIKNMLVGWKESLVERSNMYISPPASMLSNGMLFGESSMSKDLSQSFRTAGLSHIIVLSGFNIAIVIASILFVLAFLPLYVRVILAALSVIAFVIMVGGEPSVVRATLMAFIGLLAMVAGRAYVAKQALLLSFLAIILYSPISLTHDVSLHLSFLATAGIVYMGEYVDVLLRHYFPRVTSVALRGICTTTVCAYLATLPYIMYTFGTVSVYALLANILVLPFVPVAMLLSFLVVMASYVSPLVAEIIGIFDTALINCMIGVARLIETLPFSTFVLSVSLATMCGMYILFAFGIRYFGKVDVGETFERDDQGNLTGIISY